KCSYCYEVQVGFHGTGKSMSVETGKRSIDMYLERSGNRKYLDVTFFGGEPLLNFKLVRELVGYSLERASQLDKHITFKLTTNGFLLTREVIDFLVAHNFAVMISIDGDESANDIHRRDHAGPGVGRTVLTNAKTLIEAQRKANVRPAVI